MTALPPVITAFLTAVQARDVDAVAKTLHPDVRYAFAMPHPAVEGRAAVLEVFRRVLGVPARIRWDVVHSAVAGDRVHLERVDRFWFGPDGGREAAIECCGVYELADGLIAGVRDYVDLATWRERKAAATG